MTQDMCVFTVRTTSVEASQQVHEHVTDSNYRGNFSAEVIYEDSDNGGVTLTIEAHGDSYELSVFEIGIESILDASVKDAEVTVGV